MILPDVIAVYSQNQIWNNIGIDSFNNCLDKQHFANYPHQITYNYNSRGFRDVEWPEDLSQVIWCVGDSFTVGLGAPANHAWPAVLQRLTGRRCINIGLNGASNNWMSRTALAILSEFSNANIIVHWSFLHRRELDKNAALQKKFKSFYGSVCDPSWPECEFTEFDQLPLQIQKELVQDHGWTNEIFSEDRIVQYIMSDYSEDVENIKTCIQQLPKTVIHTHVPNWAPPNTQIDNVISVQQIDLARDGFHYDIKTSELLADKIISALACRATDQVH